jgi:hypothetical protein
MSPTKVLSTIVRLSLGRLSLLIVTVVAASVAAADEYSAQWGPEVGSPLAVLEAYDQAGTLRTLDNLAGEQGLLLFLNRSADW